MWPENLSLAGRGLCLRAAGKRVPAGRIRCQSAVTKFQFTCPSRSTTCEFPRTIFYSFVSIHVPLAEHDGEYLT